LFASDPPPLLFPLPGAFSSWLLTVVFSFGFSSLRLCCVFSESRPYPLSTFGFLTFPCSGPVARFVSVRNRSSFRSLVYPLSASPWCLAVPRWFSTHPPGKDALPPPPIVRAFAPTSFLCRRTGHRSSLRGLTCLACLFSRSSVPFPSFFFSVGQNLGARPVQA